MVKPPFNSFTSVGLITVVTVPDVCHAGTVLFDLPTPGPNSLTRMLFS